MHCLVPLKRRLQACSQHSSQSLIFQGVEKNIVCAEEIYCLQQCLGAADSANPQGGRKKKVHFQAHLTLLRLFFKKKKVMYGCLPRLIYIICIITETAVISRGSIPCRHWNISKFYLENEPVIWSEILLKEIHWPDSRGTVLISKFVGIS